MHQKCNTRYIWFLPEDWKTENWKIRRKIESIERLKRKRSLNKWKIKWLSHDINVVKLLENCKIIID